MRTLYGPCTSTISSGSSLSREMMGATVQQQRWTCFDMRHCRSASIVRASVSRNPSSLKTTTSPTASPFEISLASKPLALDAIRQSLIRQEDTIIYYLIERAQFCFNGPAYDPKAFKIQGFDGSLVQYTLQETERVHAKMRRYTSPEEHPFFADNLPAPAIPPVSYPQVLQPGSESININEDIWSMYFDNLLPELAAEGDDGNYGSTATLDVLCLQALSKRIHFGKFVAESKFLQRREEFEPAIRDKDTEKLNKLIFFPVTEAKVVERVEAKAKLYGQELDENGAVVPQSYRMPPHIVAALYRDWVMPLTKKVQVLYLLNRLD